MALTARRCNGEMVGAGACVRSPKVTKVTGWS